MSYHEFVKLLEANGYKHINHWERGCNVLHRWSPPNEENGHDLLIEELPDLSFKVYGELEVGNVTAAHELRNKLLLQKKVAAATVIPIVIPPITDPLGAGWSQPPTKDIEFVKNTAKMSQATFDALYEYSSTNPTGVYEGKMWKMKFKGIWYLRWYDTDNMAASLCRIRESKIIGFDVKR